MHYLTSVRRDTQCSGYMIVPITHLVLQIGVNLLDFVLLTGKENSEVHALCTAVEETAIRHMDSSDNILQVCIVQSKLLMATA
jgi:hypothetical protein